MLRKILLAAFIAVIFAIPSYADIDVTTSEPDGAGSLSYAIKKTNNGDDTIINIKHPNVSTIKLNRELTIESDVTIYGNGVTIEGTGSNRLFRITSGYAVFNGITFTGGNAASGNGGAVEVAKKDSWAEFYNCTFFGNTARDYGGAVCVTEGSIEDITRLKHCSIAGNTAGIDGGGVAAIDGDLRLYSSIVTGNNSSDDIYVSPSQSFTSFYNMIGTSNYEMDITDSTGADIADIFMLDDEGQLALRTVDNVKVLELSGTSIARDYVNTEDTSYILETDQTGKDRPMLNAYDTGAFEARPVPVESIEIYGTPYVQINGEGTISIEISPENASLNTTDYPNGIEWKSSNENVLTIDDSGNVNAVGLGDTGIGQASVTATVYGWDSEGNTKTTSAKAFTVYVGEDPATAIRATITSLDNQTVSLGGHKLVTPKITLDVSGIELQNIKAGVNYYITASSNNINIVDTEIVSDDSIRLLAGDTPGSADIEVVASPLPLGGTQSQKTSFTVTVASSSEGSTGSHGGGCNVGTLGAAFMLLLSALIHRRG